MEVLRGVVGGEVVGFFEGLVRELGLPSRLREMGVAWEEVEAVIPGVMRDHCRGTNPREVGEGDARELLREAW